MWRVIGVSRAHYYRYKAHKPSKRSLEDKDLKQLLEKAIRVYPSGHVKFRDMLDFIDAHKNC